MVDRQMRRSGQAVLGLLMSGGRQQVFDFLDQRVRVRAREREAREQAHDDV